MSSRFDLEKAIAAWRRSLEYNPALLREDVEELESHVRDQVRGLVLRGLSEEEAFERAVRQMGSYGTVESEYQKVYWGKMRRRHELTHELTWRTSMFKNYLKIAWRILLRQRAYSAINVAGLALGMAACTLIALYVRDEVSYDRHFTDADRIFRITTELQEMPLTILPPHVGPLLQRELPEVEVAARLMPGKGVMQYQDRAFQEDRFYFGDSTFIDVFDLQFLAGDPETALIRTNTVVLTASTARRYFGDENPLGKVLRRNDATDFEVTGVIEDIPENSHFGFEMLASYASLGRWANTEHWANANYYTYVLAREGVDAATLNGSIQELLERRRAVGDEPWPLSVQPLTSIHLYSDMAPEISPGGDIAYVYLFSALAVLILVIACINYMNLATARSAGRAREVGMRKALGATRIQLARQFYCDSLLLVGVGVVLAVLFVGVSLPLFNALSGKHFTVADLQGPFLPLTLGGVALVVSLVAGSYPALFLSQFAPVRVLKGTLRAGKGGARLRQGLIVFQFAISVVLVAGTLVVYRQLGYMQETNLGFAKEQLVVLPLDDQQLARSYETLANNLKQHASITNTSIVQQHPGALGWTSMARPEGMAEDERFMIKGLVTDQHLVETLGLQLIAGRSFPANSPPPDSAGYLYILNETAARMSGWAPAEAPGKRFDVEGPGEVIGVVADFHFASLHQPIEPLAIWYQPGNARNHLLVRIQGDDVAGTMAYVEQQWTALAPHRPFTFRFLDDTYNALYRSEQQMGQVAGTFSLLAIFVACLGLFGLAAFTTEQRTKEIGVRKVLGASVSGIVALLSKDFLKLVGVAFVLAVPLAYFGMQRWLEGFAYRIDIGPGLFLFIGALTLFIALLTVSYQAVKAALADPVKTLRYE
jgi:putative ABC transport system permease protein